MTVLRILIHSKRAACAALCASMLGTVNASAIDAQDEAELGRHLVKHKAASPGDLCYQDALLLGRNGRSLAVFKHYPRSMTAVQTSSAEGGRLSYLPDFGNSAKGTTFVSLNSLVPVAIAADGLSVRSASNVLLAITGTGAAEMRVRATRLADLGRLQFLSIAGGNSNATVGALNERIAAEVARNYRSERPSEDSSAAILTFYGPDFIWSRYPSLVDGGDAPAGAGERPARFVHRQVFDGRVVAEAHGARLRGLGEVSAAQDRIDMGRRFEANALVDVQDGSLVGTFNRRLLRVRIGGRTSTFRAPRFGRIISAAVSGGGSAWLYQERDVRTLVWRHGHRERRMSVRCTPPSAKAALDFWSGQQASSWSPPVTRDVRVLDLGSAGRSLPAEYVDNGKMRLIVYFGGGPSSPIVESSSADYLPAGIRHSILSVAYSGKIGLGPSLQNRLQGGGRELEIDAERVADFVRRKGFREVLIVGNSFGALPALALRQRLHTDTKLALVAPIQTIDPDQKRIGLTGGVSRVGQKRYLQELFGSPKSDIDFQHWIDRLYLASKWSPGDQMFISSYDEPLGKRLADELSRHRAVVRSIDLPHEAIFAGGVWSDISRM